jgi:hypothetical protein
MEDHDPNLENISRFDSLTNDFTREFVFAQNKIGLDADSMAKGIKDGTRATKVFAFKGRVDHYEDGKLIKSEDKVIYSRPLKDHPIRLKAQTLLLNSRGVPTTSPTNQTNIGQAGEVNIMAAVAQHLIGKGADVED